MPNFTTTTTITTSRGDTLTASKSGDYQDVFNIRQEVTNTSLNLVNAGAKSQGTLEDCRSIIVRNAGDVGGEVSINAVEWTNGTPDANGGVGSFQKYLLGAGDYMFLPNFRQLNFQNSGASAGDAYQLTNQVPDANMYVAVNNPAAGDAQLLAEALDNSETGVDVDDGDFFRVGDLIRIENEIMEVTAISSDTLTVIRGAYGSSAVVHSDNTALRFAFFNAYADFDKFSVAQTDASGRFKCSNFFGYGRTEGASAGIVPGSFSMKFYNAGYQELGMSGITESSSTGLTASTTYAFDIAVDGGSDHTLTFTTDSSNGNFGGRNGLIQKIRTALNDEFAKTSSNLISKKVKVSIVNGDIRFTSGQHLSTSAIAISAPASGTTPFGVGAFTMAVGDIEAAVSARLPDDEIRNKKTNVAQPNMSSFAYDDGHGNIKGACTGSINYDSGAIDIQGCPSNAQFVVDANYGSAHSGGNNYTSNQQNSLLSISGRSCNSKINTVFEVIGLK